MFRVQQRIQIKTRCGFNIERDHLEKIGQVSIAHVANTVFRVHTIRLVNKIKKHCCAIPGELFAACQKNMKVKKKIDVPESLNFVNYLMIERRR